jgi:nucleotide-binding universal stress UspA family protein
MIRVLVAVDETEESVRAAEVAHRLFGEEAEYVAVNVAVMVTDPSVLPWWGAGWGVSYPITYGSAWTYRSMDQSGISAAESEVEGATDEARSVADRSGLTGAEAVGEVGDPADAVLRVAQERAVDVIVLGTHDRGWFDRLVHPSVTKGVVRRAEIPVLVVK